MTRSRYDCHYTPSSHFPLANCRASFQMPFVNTPRRSPRLAIVTTHPIQYYAPWFRWMAVHGSFSIKVFYLWDFGVVARNDPGFGQSFEWDVPLLEGYDNEFVPNASRDPGTHHFWGMRNPDLLPRLKEFAPDAALLIGYNYASFLRLILAPESRRGFPLFMRGDSHRLVETGNAKGEGRKAIVRHSKSAIRNFFISRIFRRFAALLYVGQANRDYFRLHGVPDERLFFSPHAVENERFSASCDTVAREALEWRRAIGIKDEHLLIQFAGKFEEKKRPLDLLEAYKQLRRDDVALLFAGSGKLEGELRERARNVPNIFFAPFQNQTKMPRTYAACDLFVLPSFGPEETWGLAINEALCLARPVIVSDHVGCAADLVRDGENGLVFQAGDVDGLAAALTDALSDRTRLRQWGLAGKELVERYDFAAATKGLVEASVAAGVL
jgi:glycosyltransferase involved in cell wall biosynthesis